MTGQAGQSIPALNPTAANPANGRVNLDQLPWSQNEQLVMPGQNNQNIPVLHPMAANPANVQLAMAGHGTPTSPRPARVYLEDGRLAVSFPANLSEEAAQRPEPPANSLGFRITSPDGTGELNLRTSNYVVNLAEMCKSRWEIQPPDVLKAMGPIGDDAYVSKNSCLLALCGLYPGKRILAFVRHGGGEAQVLTAGLRGLGFNAFHVHGNHADPAAARQLMKTFISAVSPVFVTTDIDFQSAVNQGYLNQREIKAQIIINVDLPRSEDTFTEQQLAWPEYCKGAEGRFEQGLPSKPYGLSDKEAYESRLKAAKVTWDHVTVLNLVTPNDYIRVLRQYHFYDNQNLFANPVRGSKLVTMTWQDAMQHAFKHCGFKFVEYDHSKLHFDLPLWQYTENPGVGSRACREMWWLTIGLLAPEVVAWTAFEQHREAKALWREIKKELGEPIPCSWREGWFGEWREPKVAGTRTDVESGIQVSEPDSETLSPAEEPTTRNGPSQKRNPVGQDNNGEKSPGSSNANPRRRRNEWTMTHSHYAVMGGFAFDTSVIGDGEDFLLGGRQ
ncbi:hypothetical protein OQA88_2364 [Cercophora sp. LCS_1]